MSNAVSKTTVYSYADRKSLHPYNILQKIGVVGSSIGEWRPVYAFTFYASSKKEALAMARRRLPRGIYKTVSAMR